MLSDVISARELALRDVVRVRETLYCASHDHEK